MRRDFSSKEIEMFIALGMETELDFKVKIRPFQLYQFAVNKVFVENLAGEAVESLRRTFKALGEGIPRFAEEFDNLIEL
jgi:hypothetical protein